jgi:hypothetical protein
MINDHLLLFPVVLMEDLQKVAGSGKELFLQTKSGQYVYSTCPLKLSWPSNAAGGALLLALLLDQKLLKLLILYEACVDEARSYMKIAV